MCFPDDDLETLLDEVVRASNRGVSASKNVTGGPNWSFGQSLFFSSTVVTTIGKFTSLYYTNKGHSVKFRHPLPISKKYGGK